VSETFPGCASDADGGCGTWSLAPERTYIYFTDINHDGTIDDLCALYGAPYLLAFPYVYPYGYLPNNLLISVGPDCSRPSAVETTSWGRVKALLQ
jgi:hypothetical protein